MTAALALAGPAGASTMHPSGYQFRTVDNAQDLTFNQLLGVNNEGVIAGYFGSARRATPTRGTCCGPTATTPIRTRTSPARCRPRSPA
jgi:hypothetical protein